ncbi:MAG: hypothetical protein H7Z71_05465 [Moraxellaceae bacterium]|nr:hypothetical protein [Pseudobdellovibrionaceae bacterium]
MFGFLSFKNLFTQYNENSNHHCDEFGHIHNYQLAAKAETSKFPSFKIVSVSAQNSDDLSDCHEGKFVFSHALISEVWVEQDLFVSRKNFVIDFKIEDHFARPYLEPARKPPRLI